MPYPIDKLKDQIKYITNPQDHFQVWRTNPSDPVIYISFSLEQFAAVHQNDPRILTYLEDQTISPTAPEIIKLYRALIKKHFMNFEGMPFKFLSPAVKPYRLKNKNICFILSMDRTYADIIEKFGKASFETIAVSDGVTKNAAYKFILMPKIINSEEFLSIKYIRNVFLHELLHGLIEAKHAKKYHAINDKAPFSDTLTCLDTLMVYDESCPPVMEKYAEYRHILEQPGLSLSNFLFIREKIFSDTPTALGPIDKAAVVAFIESWNKRNAILPIRKTSSETTKPVETTTPATIHDELFDDALSLYLMQLTVASEAPHSISTFDYFTDFFNTSITYLENAVKELVDTCPSYFPETPARSRYWSGSSGLTFYGARTTDTLDSATALPAPTCPRIGY